MLFVHQWSSKAPQLKRPVIRLLQGLGLDPITCEMMAVAGFAKQVQDISRPIPTEEYRHACDISYFNCFTVGCASSLQN